VKRWRFATATLALLSIVPEISKACSVCFGALESESTKPILLSIGFMIGLTAVVLSATTFFVLRLIKELKRQGR